jgi:pyruvate/2-oxoglutarate dehydrogenase complex dihydrolipoamide dehydrogenase (E3) component
MAKSESAGNRNAAAQQATTTILPDDPHNRRLQESVRPANWVNPRPNGRYNLIVIGAGSAGLVSAVGAAGLGARVAIIERQWLGGDCLNVGCVPSKALIRSGRAVADVRHMAQFGMTSPSAPQVDFAEVMERMRRIRADLSPHDSANRLRGLGIDVYFGQATFIGRDRIRVGDDELRFQRAVIATGARAAQPKIPGLETIDFLTNETIFSLTELPPRLAVIGAGPIGCELAQCFARFGSDVVMVDAAPGILPQEDRDAAETVAQVLRRDEIEIHCPIVELSCSKQGHLKQLRYQFEGRWIEQSVDAVLLSTGRTANVEGLGLDAAGVQFDSSGVLVNTRLRTTNRRIFAAGDVCSPYKFTHAADAMARIAIQNALFLGRAKFKPETLPHCTYTDPELARVGLSQQQAADQGMAISLFEYRFSAVDRGVLDGETEGFVRVLTRQGSDRILGATIVGSHAGDMISELALAMTAGIGLRKIAKTVHPYPTRSECIKKVADAYNRSRLSPSIQSLLRAWMSWGRR